MEATRTHEEEHINYAKLGVEKINSELGFPMEFDTNSACQNKLVQVLSAWNKRYARLAYNNSNHLEGAPIPTSNTFDQEYAAGLCEVEKL